jgi:hypothetical protein
MEKSDVLNSNVIGSEIGIEKPSIAVHDLALGVQEEGILGMAHHDLLQKRL